MLRLKLIAAAISMASCACLAQNFPVDPTWQENQIPAPAALRLEGLIALAMPVTDLRVAVDPTSITVGSDGVVRYVVTATSSSGTINAMYEGIRCATAEVKLYARHVPTKGWSPTMDEPWRSLHELPRGRHSLLIAREGACTGRVPKGSANEIVQSLKSGYSGR